MAKITTITNPLTGQPAQVDQLDHTAQEIDDAIARSLPGGAIDITLQNKAPAGYGYGGVVPSNINIANGTETQLESQLDTVIAAMADGEAKRIRVICTPLLDTQYLCEIFRYTSTYAVVTGVAAGGVPSTATASRISKAKKNGVWYPLEWENPPMLLGGVDADGNPINEYRTTERYLGKPVYAKAMTYAFVSSYDSASQFGLEIPHEISNFGSLVRAEAVSPPYMIPYVSKNGGFAGVRAVNATNILFDSYKTSWSSGNKITFKLFYTKS